MPDASRRRSIRFIAVRDANPSPGEHVPQLLVKAWEAEQAANADDLLSKLTGMMERFERFLDEAESVGDGAEFRAHAAEWRRHLETLAKIRGQLAQEGTVSLTLSAEWVELRALIVQALRPYDAARNAVLQALASRSGLLRNTNGAREATDGHG